MKKIINYIFIVIAVLISILTILSFSEYINVAILKNIENYPFGGEGPVAGVNYYENASAYSMAMLYYTISGLVISLTLWLALLKEKIKLLLLGVLMLIVNIIITYIIY